MSQDAQRPFHKPEIREEKLGNQKGDNLSSQRSVESQDLCTDQSRDKRKKSADETSKLELFGDPNKTPVLSKFANPFGTSPETGLDLASPRNPKESPLSATSKFKKLQTLNANITTPLLVEGGLNIDLKSVKRIKSTENTEMRNGGIDSQAQLNFNDITVERNVSPQRSSQMMDAQGSPTQNDNFISLDLLLNHSKKTNNIIGDELDFNNYSMNEDSKLKTDGDTTFQSEVDSPILSTPNKEDCNNDGNSNVVPASSDDEGPPSDPSEILDSIQNTTKQSTGERFEFDTQTQLLPLASQKSFTDSKDDIETPEELAIKTNKIQSDIAPQPNSDIASQTKSELFSISNNPRVVTNKNSKTYKDHEFHRNNKVPTDNEHQSKLLNLEPLKVESRSLKRLKDRKRDYEKLVKGSGDRFLAKSSEGPEDVDAKDANDINLNQRPVGTEEIEEKKDESFIRPPSKRRLIESKNSVTNIHTYGTQEVYKLSGLTQEEANNNLYETQIIPVTQPTQAVESSSPQANFLNNDVDQTEFEIPNTSGMSVDKMDILSAKSTYESTPIKFQTNRTESHSQGNVNGLLTKLNRQSIASDMSIESHTVLRDRIEQELTIFDVLDNSTVFVNTNNTEIFRIVETFIGDDGVQYFEVKSSQEYVPLTIKANKIFAPLCLNIGDTVKYKKDKKYSYEITGLMKDENEFLECYGGFNKLYIKRKNSECEEIITDLSQLYLTKQLKSTYKYPLFNELDNFSKFIDSQTAKLMPNVMMNEQFQTEPVHSLGKKLPFSDCIFVLTGIPGLHSRPGTRSENMTAVSSRTSTPHNRSHIIDKLGKLDVTTLTNFLESQGAYVINDRGFEQVIPLKLNRKASPKKDISRNALPTECADMDTSHEYMVFHPQNVKTRPLSLDPKLNHYKFACVLATKHSRTMKYLQALCLKWPIIHCDFVIECMNNPVTLEKWTDYWQRYVLPAGEVKYSGGYTANLNIFQWYEKWKAGATIKDTIGLSRLFEGSRIIVVNDSIKQLMRWKRTRHHHHHNYTASPIRSGRKMDSTQKRSASSVEEDFTAQETSEDDGDEHHQSYHAREGYSVDRRNEGQRGVENSHLLWLFTILGFKEVIVLRKALHANSLLDIIHANTSDKGKWYLYLKMDDIAECQEVCETLIGNNTKIQPVNWEWLVQCIIAHRVFTL